MSFLMPNAMLSSCVCSSAAEPLAAVAVRSYGDASLLHAAFSAPDLATQNKDIQKPSAPPDDYNLI